MHVVWTRWPRPVTCLGGHRVCSAPMSPLRVDCLLFRVPVTFAGLDGAVPPVSAPHSDALILSLRREGGDQGPGPQRRADVSHPPR